MKALHPIEKLPITHTQLVKYAGASGDFNPIHTVVPVAQKAGLKDVIAHGMLIMGFAGEAIAKWFPRRSVKSFRVRFAKMTFPGEKLTVYGNLIDETQGIYRGEVFVKNEHGEIKLSGSFEIEEKGDKK